MQKNRGRHVSPHPRVKHSSWGAWATSEVSELCTVREVTLSQWRRTDSGYQDILLKDVPPTLRTHPSTDGWATREASQMPGFCRLYTPGTQDMRQGLEPCWGAAERMRWSLRDRNGATENRPPQHWGQQQSWIKWSPLQFKGKRRRKRLLWTYAKILLHKKTKIIACKRDDVCTMKYHSLHETNFIKQLYTQGN